jgi:hypothetical protein
LHPEKDSISTIKTKCKVILIILICCSELTQEKAVESSAGECGDQGTILLVYLRAGLPRCEERLTSFIKLFRADFGQVQAYISHQSLAIATSMG